MSTVFVEEVSDIGVGVMERAAEMATERLEAEIKTLSGHLAAALCRWLLLVAEFDRREGWGQWECRSCTHWLSWQCGMSLRTAQEHLRVAHALEVLSLVRARFSRGELSYSQVRAISRVVDGPVAEEFLVHYALHATAAMLEKMVKGYRRTGRLDDQAAEDRHARRCFEWWVDDDGMVCFRGRLAPEEAQVVIAAIGAVTVPATKRSAERPVDDQGVPLPQPGDDPKAARQADALVAVCEMALTGGGAASRASIGTEPADNGADRAAAADTDTGAESGARAGSASATGGGEAPATPRATPTPEAAATPEAATAPGNGAAAPGTDNGGRSGLVSDPTATVVVLVEEEVLALDADGVCRLEGGPNLSPETARRLACDATSFTIAVGPDGTPRLVGKAFKTMSTRLRRELGIRDDGCCQFPGCDLLGRLHAHHIVHREHHGPNQLDNLITLCAFHHRLVHEGGYRIEVLLGEVLVHRPGREPLAHTPAGRVDDELELRNLAEGLDITDDTAMSLWDGTRVRADDLSWAILSVRDRQN
ncbi:MAG: DUF222 domain-containing protein [Acidimicrobiales bacterium]|nr:DUF222 domain-containing protein [Acidimicrobiales bacterium]